MTAPGNTPATDDLWLETSLAHVVVALLDDDGRLSEWEAGK